MPCDPKDEWVDVIDADGQTVGTVTRREMRERHLRHRCTYLLVFNRQGDLFIHLRTATKDVFPSHWDVAVGGVVLAGESFDAAALREAREELGVDLHLERLFDFCYADGRAAAHGIVYRACHDGPFTYQVEEIVRGEFVPVAEVFKRAQRHPFCPDGLQVLATYERRQSLA